MSNALLSDVEARAERRRTRTRDQMRQELAEAAWRRGQDTTDPVDQRRWLDRAHRLAPHDGLIALALAGMLLQARDAEGAAALFQDLAGRFGGAEAWTGLAACAHVLGQPARAEAAVAAALRSSVPTPALRGVAAAVAGKQGWCGLDSDGVLHAGPARPVLVRLDDAPVRPRWSGLAARLPPGWDRAGFLHVDGPAGPLVGSPIPIPAILATEGFVQARDGGLEGWAWHPADPARDPLVLVRGQTFSAMLTARVPAEDVRTGRPMARPRHFALSAVQAEAMGGPLAVMGRNGRALWGSPVDPGLLARIAPAWADTLGPPPAPGTTRPPVDVVIPVYRGLAETLACLASVLASIPRGTRIYVVEDASPEPDLAAALDTLARRRRIRLIRLPENQGFPAAANAGLRACAGRDAVLLNSDTLVAPGWLDRLRTAAYSAPDIGTATPLSNDATILSYPSPGGGNPVPDLPGTLVLDGLAQRANGDAVVDIPVGVGFCLYLRRDCLDQVGLLREDLFAQGYGEENDLCLRARHLGWRSVAAPGVFVAHVGGRSFGPARTHLIARNGAVLNRLYPGYDALVAAHIAADPLAPARRRMDALRWAEERSRLGAVLLLTHAGGGGVDQVIEARCAALRAEGLRPVVLRPGRAVCRVEPSGFPNLAYAIPEELPALAALLRPDRPRFLEVHHLLGHHHEAPGLARLLKLPVETYVHDYSWFCPRIALVSRERRYCGEPDVPGCEACVADLGSLLEDDPPIRTLLARSAAALAVSRRVIAPSMDAAARLRRHFPMVRPVVVPWEGDDALPPAAAVPPGPVCRVCIVGAIGMEKGYEVLLACVRDARARKLPLEFIVVGYTADDQRLLDAGPVFVTGEYREAEAVALIQAQGAHIGFLPSVWPETWCFALSRAWQAGLRVAAFDLGAQAERLRRNGRGWLLPLGLSPRAVNDALLALAPVTQASQCPPHRPNQAGTERN